jgi:AcrR family transcriptional regulator
MRDRRTGKRRKERSPPAAHDARPLPAAHEADGRRRILEAAVRSFAERGYAGTTTAGVAREAGVTQPLVHHHFGSKDGLWKAAMDHVFAEIPAVLAATDRPTDPRDELYQMIAPFVRLSAARPELVRILSREGAAPSPRLTYLIEQHVGPPLAFVAASIRKAQRAGLIARNLPPELLLFLALGAGSHVFDVAALAKQALGIDVASETTREAFVELFHRIFVSGVRP